MGASLRARGARHRVARRTATPGGQGAGRGACDRKPVDLAEPVQRRRLKAYIWPDQTDRLERLESAIAETRAAGITVEAQDAVVWARREARPSTGVATVVFHSVFFGYLPAESQAALVQSGHDGAASNPVAQRRGPAPSHRPSPRRLDRVAERRATATILHPLDGAWMGAVARSA